MSIETAVSARDKTGTVILRHVTAIADKSIAVATRTGDRLAPLIEVSSSLTKDKDKMISKPQDPYPSYFDELRQSLNVISASLETIESYLDRLEV